MVNRAFIAAAGDRSTLVRSMNLALSRCGINPQGLQGLLMPVQQKAFRIESMQPGSATAGAAAGATSVVMPEDILSELKELRALIERRVPQPAPGAAEQITIKDLNKLKIETDNIHRAISRTMRELASLHMGAFNGEPNGGARRHLDAVIVGTERATQQILEAAEGIDDAANMFWATLKSETERDLASDIREHVVRIFEACNFQDLTGQRITKVLATLQFVEERVQRMMEIWGGRDVVKDYADGVLAEPRGKPGLANGPKLDGEPGHASQDEIDALFA
jgi:chemotaxis protein CheZ